jgi:hypothetical protein
MQTFLTQDIVAGDDNPTIKIQEFEMSIEDDRGKGKFVKYTIKLCYPSNVIRKR